VQTFLSNQIALTKLTEQESVVILDTRHLSGAFVQTNLFNQIDYFPFTIYTVQENMVILHTGGNNHEHLSGAYCANLPI